MRQASRFVCVLNTNMLSHQPIPALPATACFLPRTFTSSNAQRLSTRLLASLKLPHQSVSCMLTREQMKPCQRHSLPSLLLDFDGVSVPSCFVLFKAAC